MNIFSEMVGNRRELFRATARYTLLAALGLAGYLCARSGKLNGQRCLQQGICSGCRQFANCGLPAALSRKQKAAATKS